MHFTCLGSDVSFTHWLSQCSAEVVSTQCWLFYLSRAFSSTFLTPYLHLSLKPLHSHSELSFPFLSFTFLFFLSARHSKDSASLCFSVIIAKMATTTTSPAQDTPQPLQYQVNPTFLCHSNPHLPSILHSNCGLQFLLQFPLFYRHGS